MRRLFTASLVVFVSFSVGMNAFTVSAGAKSKAAWSLKFTGGIAGSAKTIKVINCTQAEPDGNQLNPIANFTVGRANYQIQIHLDPPLQAGPRPFGHSSSSSTAGINVIALGKSNVSWTTGDGNGSVTLHADLKSGSLSGQLIGLGANGIATTVTGRFSCPSFKP